MLAPDFYPDEDADQIRKDFVQLWAKFPNFSAQDVAIQVFMGKPEGLSRGLQAASIWQFDLSILSEKERLMKLGVAETRPKTKEEYLAQVEAAYSNPEITNAQVKALELEGKARGFIDSKIADNAPISNEKLLSEIAAMLPN